MLRRGQSERGATLVEFGIVVPLLVLFLFGIIEFGFVYNDYLSLRSAAREGGRLAAVNNGCVGSNSGCVASATAQRDDLLADTRAKISGLSGSTGVLVSVALPEGDDVGDDVLVCLNRGVQSRTGLFAPFVNPITLKASARMRLEQKPTFQAGASASDPAGTSGGAGPAPSC